MVQDEVFSKSVLIGNYAGEDIVYLLYELMERFPGYEFYIKARDGNVFGLYYTSEIEGINDIINLILSQERKRTFGILQHPHEVLV